MQSHHKYSIKKFHLIKMLVFTFVEDLDVDWKSNYFLRILT